MSLYVYVGPYIRLDASEGFGLREQLYAKNLYGIEIDGTDKVAFLDNVGATFGHGFGRYHANPEIVNPDPAQEIAAFMAVYGDVVASLPSCAVVWGVFAYWM